MSDKKETPRDIEILPSDYEPTQAEMNETFSIDTTPEALAKAVMQPVNVHRKDVSEHKASRSKKS
ncbi:MAG: hypothetical protein OXG10_00335 [Candidatus Dadabacteria bacterium]|nr:hypothetical protein [Candidatus Dadabacteria bacterium]